MAFASIHWFGAMIDTEVIEANAPEIIRQLRVSKVLPILDFPLKRIYPGLVEKFYHMVRSSDSNPFAMRGILEGVEVVLDVDSLSKAFPGLSTSGAKSLSSDLLETGWPSLRPNEGPWPNLKSAENKKRDYPLVPQFHAELIDRALLCKSGSHDKVSYIQQLMMSAIALNIPTNWAHIMIGRIIEAQKLFLDGKGKPNFCIILSHFLASLPNLSTILRSQQSHSKDEIRIFNLVDLTRIQNIVSEENPSHTRPSKKTSNRAGTLTIASSSVSQAPIDLTTEDSPLPRKPLIVLPGIRKSNRPASQIARLKSQQKLNLLNTNTFIPFNKPVDRKCQPIRNPSFHISLRNPFKREGISDIPPNWVFPIDHFPPFIRKLLSFHELKKELKPFVDPSVYVDKSPSDKIFFSKLPIPFERLHGTTAEELRAQSGKYFELLPLQWNQIYLANERFVQDELIQDVWVLYTKTFDCPNLTIADPYLIGRAAVPEDDFDFVDEEVRGLKLDGGLLIKLHDKVMDLLEAKIQATEDRLAQIRIEDEQLVQKVCEESLSAPKRKERPVIIQEPIPTSLPKLPQVEGKGKAKVDEFESEPKKQKLREYTSGSSIPISSLDTSISLVDTCSVTAIFDASVPSFSAQIAPLGSDQLSTALTLALSAPIIFAPSQLILPPIVPPPQTSELHHSQFPEPIFTEPITTPKAQILPSFPPVTPMDEDVIEPLVTPTLPDINDNSSPIDLEEMDDGAWYFGPSTPPVTSAPIPDVPKFRSFDDMTLRLAAIESRVDGLTKLFHEQFSKLNRVISYRSEVTQLALDSLKSYFTLMLNLQKDSMIASVRLASSTGQQPTSSEWAILTASINAAEVRIHEAEVAKLKAIQEENLAKASTHFLQQEHDIDAETIDFLKAENAKLSQQILEMKERAILRAREAEEKRKEVEQARGFAAFAAAEKNNEAGTSSSKPQAEEEHDQEESTKKN